MMRRRRATGSPAEQTFRELVGLDLRPVDARQACAAWEKIMDTQGPEAADALWRHPDTLPSFGGAAEKTKHDWDASLDALLREESGKGDGTDAGSGTGSDGAGSAAGSGGTAAGTGTPGEDQGGKSDDDPHGHGDTDGDDDGHPDDPRRS